MAFRLKTGVAPLAIAIATLPVAASAQEAGVSAEGDIIVTARKRDETSIAVPVALTAVGAAELQRRAINTIDSLARVVPGLVVGDNNSLTGGIIAIRGLAGADTNGFGDQAVSFNIDGVGIGRATVRRMAGMDIQQVEVLKGPQALFFGKNSPAGIISIRTADPTPDFQAKISAGYEFRADEIRTEGYISGPISDTLGFRVAGYYSDMKGWAKNRAPAANGVDIFGPQSRRSPNGDEIAGRLTLKWEPVDSFSARFKFNYGRVKDDGPTSLFQLVDCPLGAPQGSFSPPEDCKLNNITFTSKVGPNFGKFYDERMGDGHLYQTSKQILSSLELNYNLNDNLTLTSVTGYYHLRYESMSNNDFNFRETGTPPKTLLVTYQNFKLREISQELRLTSGFDGPVNFMFGGQFSDTSHKIDIPAAINAITPAFVQNFHYEQDSTSNSVFGQGMVDLLPTVELSVGARYSHEKKTLPVAQSAVGNDPRCVGMLDKRPCVSTLYDVQGPLFIRKATFNNLSPEATLSWRPTQNLNIYGSYKEGFLSGGLSGVAPAGFTLPALQTSVPNSYDQQTTKGFEVGVKAALLDGALRTNFSLYSYKTLGLQVTVTQITNVVLRNAGAVRTKGAEFDFTYRTPLEGLTLNGGFNYNKGTYLDYQASCYRGQSSATCFIQPSRTDNGRPSLLQDLSGTRLVRAPRWSGNAGFNFETPITDGIKIGLNGNMNFSTGYFTQVTSSPGSFQKSYEIFDAGIRIAQADDKWELAVIGRNLTDKYYMVRSADVPFTGTNPGCSPARTGSPANCTGVHVTNPARADTSALPARGREVMVRVSTKF